MIFMSFCQTSFFIVAASAPLTAVAGGQAATYLVTGNKGIPFLFIPLAIVLGTFAVGYAAMSHHVADAGAFYTYVTRGLGRIPGVGTAFLMQTVIAHGRRAGYLTAFGMVVGAGIYALSVHLVVKDAVACNNDAILSAVKHELFDRFGIDHTTIQIESETYAHLGEVH